VNGFSPDPTYSKNIGGSVILKTSLAAGIYVCMYGMCWWEYNAIHFHVKVTVY
jgi:hypothetical protein